MRRRHEQMFGGIIRFFCGGLCAGCYVRLFKHQVDHPVACGPQAKQERKPTDDEDMGPDPAIHREEYSRKQKEGCFL